MSDQALDDFVQRACQACNLGNDGNWFLSFRGGLYGVRSRVAGARYHSAMLHGGIPRPPSPSVEHHIAVILHCMDSALECFVFMLNALGQATDPKGFRLIADETQLKRITPRDLLEDRCEGYRTLFPRVREYWHGSAELVRLIFENHDIAKHRTQTSRAGSYKEDSFPTFPGVDATPEALAEFQAALESAPMKEVLLPRQPKLPVAERSGDLEHWTTLEELEAGWEAMIAASFSFAVADARAGIPLSTQED